MAYVCLVIAIAAEIIATSALKSTEGFTKLIPSIFCMCAYILCHVTFSKAILKLNLGIAYAIWCGVGIVVTTAVGILIYKEKISVLSFVGIIVICIGCILVNVGGMKG